MYGQLESDGVFCLQDKRNEYVITADIPGASKDMVEVSVDDDRVLHIVDERADRHEERGGSEADGEYFYFYLYYTYGKLV
jgi:HSP20 family molecular chaperone IbpA